MRIRNGGQERFRQYAVSDVSGTTRRFVLRIGSSPPPLSSHQGGLPLGQYQSPIVLVTKEARYQTLLHVGEVRFSIAVTITLVVAH